MKTASWTAETFRDPGVTLFIDKPLDWTSYQVVRKIRSLFNVKKVGHAGTLDPKATGLLILCTGKRTKEIAGYMGLEKEYEGAFELGIRTPSFDLETEVMERKDFSRISAESIVDAASQMTGDCSQLPPMYSALKKNGKPLYTYARKGQEIAREERMVRIERFDILAIELPRVEFRVVCSKGTYVRSLVDDLGRRLGCGATLAALKRTRIGPHTLAEASSVGELNITSQDLGIVRPARHADRSSN
jgi:tRNA pseudouridine55 synthase